MILKQSTSSYPPAIVAEFVKRSVILPGWDENLRILGIESIGEYVCGDSMANECGENEVSTEKAKTAAEGANDLSDDDRSLFLKVLDERHRAPDNLASRLQENKVCHDEKHLLGRAKLDGVTSQGLSLLDQVLVPGKDNKPADKPKFIVMDKTDSHADAVAGVIKAKSPGLSDQDIQFISPDMAMRLKNFVATPYTMVNLSEKDRREIVVADSYGERISNDLKKLLPEVKNNPDVVINISMGLFDVGLKVPGENENQGRVTNISSNELDMKGIKSIDQIDKTFVNDLASHINARSDSDLRARYTSEIVDRLKDLADAGAQIRLAWGNHDVVAVNKLLAQVHPNIKAVGALDAKGRVAAYNERTAHLTGEQQAGTILFMPAEQMNKIDKKFISQNVTLVEKPSNLKNDFSGEDLSSRWMKSSDFRQLKNMQPLAKEIYDVERILLSTQAGYHAAVEPKTHSELYDKLSKINPAETEKLIGKRVEFVDRMQEIGRVDTTQLSDKELEAHLSKHNPLFDKVHAILYSGMAADLNKLGYPQKDKQTPVDVLQSFYQGFEKIAGAGVLNKRELREIYGADGAAFLDQQKQGAYLFRLTGPDVLKTPPDGYVTVRDKNGGKVLAQEWVGTSFASPIAAARARRQDGRT